MCTSICVAAKLGDPASEQVLQYVVRQLADRETSVIHLVVVIFQKQSRTEERRAAQTLVRQQFGSLIPASRPHRLHIVRLLTKETDTADLSSYIGRAICSKAAALESDVIVVGGKARRSAMGHVRNSAVAEAVRKYSRRPVLLMSDEHPLLCPTLPAIAEELHDLSDEELSSQDLVTSPKAAARVPGSSSELAGQLLASISQAAGLGPADKAHLTGPQPRAAAHAPSLSVAAC